jgi:predicted amidophosphoribosyltransferase
MLQTWPTRNTLSVTLGAMTESILAAVGSVLAPPLCWGCRGSARTGEPLCLACRASLRSLGPQTVALAGLETWAPFAYEGVARELVRALKYRGATRIADAMAAHVVARAPPDLLHRTTLVPVPLHPARARRRGFDQAALLAQAVAHRAARPIAPCLVRGGRPSAQVGRDRPERIAGVTGHIWAGTGAPLHSTLVDDVATTGATLAACAAALRGAGAREVRALAFARTLGR